MSRQDEQFLVHYGILGMKWGIRRDRQKLGGTSTTPKTTVPRPKRPGEMTLDELKKANERLKAEKEYRDYIAATKQKKKSGLGEFLLKAASTAALGYLESAAKAYGTKVGGRKDPDPNQVKSKGQEKVKKILSKAADKPVTLSTSGKKKVTDLIDWMGDDWDW